MPQEDADYMLRPAGLDDVGLGLPWASFPPTALSTSPILTYLMGLFMGS